MRSSLVLANGVKDDLLRQHYETEALDASALLAAIFGFLPPKDRRLRASVLAIAEDLAEDGFVLSLPNRGNRRRPLW